MSGADRPVVSEHESAAVLLVLLHPAALTTTSTPRAALCPNKSRRDSFSSISRAPRTPLWVHEAPKVQCAAGCLACAGSAGSGARHVRDHRHHERQYGLELIAGGVDVDLHHGSVGGDHDGV